MTLRIGHYRSLFWITALSVLLSLLTVSATLADDGLIDEFNTDEVMCRLGPTLLIDSLLVKYDLAIKDFIPEIESYLFDVSHGRDLDSLATVIFANEDVIYCTPNYILNAPEPVQQSQPFVDNTGGSNFDSQQAVSSLNLSGAQTLSSGLNISVAVIDGGVNFGHEVFGGTALSGFDYVDNDSNANDEPNGSASGHGTFVAGIIKLTSPGVIIRAYRVLDTAGSGDGYRISEAIVRAVVEGCKVLNMSFVMTTVHESMSDAIAYARANDVTVIAAAGNDDLDFVRYPASDANSISVTALDSTLRKADFANYATAVSVSAPGTMVIGPFLDSTYVFWSGTSFAAPFVSGQAALLYELQPNATSAIIESAIKTTAVDVDSLNPLYVGKLGVGLVDPTGSLEQITSDVCGDANGDSSVNIADVTFLISFIFTSGPAPPNETLADADGSSSVNIADVTFLIQRIFQGGPAPICDGA